MSLLSFGVSNFDSAPSSASKQDRFIPSRAEIEDFAESYRTSPRRRSIEVEDVGGDENRAYTKAVTSTLNLTNSLKKPVQSTRDLGAHSRRIEGGVRAQGRKIPRTPFKILDAPKLQDDFYFNVLAWSASDVLAVGLGEAVYTWNFKSNKVERVAAFEKGIFVTGVCWSNQSDHFAVGAQTGAVELWDAGRGLRIRQVEGHTERVGALSLNGNMLLTGSRDKNIFLHDLRSPSSPLAFPGHRQEVCGLRWSPDGEYFASGGNDNKLFVFSPKMALPLMRKGHKAAVKALAWSERTRGLLATGAGTADRCIRLWNINEKLLVDFKDTASQICNIAFSKLEDELITTHGFSHNEVCIWRLKGLKKVAALSGHTSRVLYLAVDPRGENIVTGAGDETLRFWNLGYPTRDTASRSTAFEPLSAFR